MTADGFEARHAVLIEELRALADAVPAPSPAIGDAMADVVLARLPAIRRRHRPLLLRRRLVIIAAAVVAALAALLAAPPVRAVVRDWFGFGGVHVRITPTPAPTTAPPPPTVAPNASMAQATAALGFTPLVPAELGPPDAVQVSADRRLVSMSWTGGRDGTVRLDEWAAELDGLAAKTARGVRFTTVDGNFALWFDAPHEVVLATDDHGGTRTEPPRLAGHTLIWQTPRATLRLEGHLTFERALEIASSSRPAG
jgi:hypothetical protein